MKWGKNKLGVVILGIGVTTALLNFSGKTHCAMHLLKKVAGKRAKQTFDILINFGLIPFSPGTERFLKIINTTINFFDCYLMKHETLTATFYVYS